MHPRAEPLSRGFRIALIWVKWLGMMGVGNKGRSLSAARFVCANLFAAFLIGLLTSCNSATFSGSVAPADVDVLDKIRSVDILPRQTQPISNSQDNAGQRGQAAVF